MSALQQKGQWTRHQFERLTQLCDVLDELSLSRLLPGVRILKSRQESFLLLLIGARKGKERRVSARRPRRDGFDDGRRIAYLVRFGERERLRSLGPVRVKEGLDGGDLGSLVSPAVERG